MRSAAVFLILAALVAPAAAKSTDMPSVMLAANEPGDVTVRDGAGGATPAVPAARPLPENGSSAETVFREVGMFGTWAADCGRPASLDNPYVDVSAPGAGLVLENNDVGPGYAANRYSVLMAQQLPGHRVEVSVIFRPGAPGEERQTLVIEVHDGTRRTVFNRVEGGDIRVRHGIVLSRGIKTPVLRKCG
jgi:hypothetical protein